jgi:hypothetical protein
MSRHGYAGSPLRLGPGHGLAPRRNGLERLRAEPIPEQLDPEELEADDTEPAMTKQHLTLSDIDQAFPRR